VGPTKQTLVLNSLIKMAWTNRYLLEREGWSTERYCWERKIIVSVLPTPPTISSLILLKWVDDGTRRS
jgi:hypothetical protein